jgi:hypothetical protein
MLSVAISVESLTGQGGYLANHSTREKADSIVIASYGSFNGKFTRIEHGATEPKTFPDYRVKGSTVSVMIQDA